MMYGIGAILVCAAALIAAFEYNAKVKSINHEIKLQANSEILLFPNEPEAHVLRRMLTMADTIREGANTFMRTQYGYIIFVLLAMVIFNSLLIEVTTGITLMFGALMSTAGCVVSMHAATYANVVTAFIARKSKNIRLTGAVALLGGAVPGLCIAAFGLLGFETVKLIFGVDRSAVGTSLVTGIVCNPSTQRFVAYSCGCSMIALFNRVAGGNFTKAADMSSDLVGKVTVGVDEDDWRIPSVIADFIGDNVNDVGGNGSDLLESYVAAIASVVMSGVELATTDAQAQAVSSFATAIAASGLLACLVSLALSLRKVDKGIVKLLNDEHAQITKKDTVKDLGFLDTVMVASAVITIAATALFAYICFKDNSLDDFKYGWISPAIAPIIGIASGLLITKITEYYTSLHSKAVRDSAENAVHGPAFLITTIDAWGYASVLWPVIVIALSIFVAHRVCGFFGIGCTALGMLSFVSAPVSIDAFGPVSDNAGGIAESCIKDPADLSATRSVTDVCDAEGNTRAAVAKGFAIGGAASATISLNFSYIQVLKKYAANTSLSLENPTIFVGILLGAGFVAYFVALLLMNTKSAAWSMAKESLRQLEIGAPVSTDEKGNRLVDFAKGNIFTGKTLPDYLTCIKIATKESVRNMIKPTLIVILAPALIGFVLGAEANGGFLNGATVISVVLAIFMGNSGGIADNAKKFIEAGLLPGYKKGSLAHKTAVEGDTLGDPRKDVVGVDLDILIKLSATVSITLAPLFCQFSIF